MLHFLTSLTFLYAFSILLLLLFGMRYYRHFSRNGYQPRLFPWVWLTIAAACMGFLWVNTRAPLSLHTYSNIDHHFIRHDGFRVAGSIELGRTDTASYRGNAFNRFVLEKNNGQLQVRSVYSEEPFYIAGGKSHQLASASFTATGHTIRFRADSALVSIRAASDSSYELKIGETLLSRSGRLIRKGTNSWNIFKDDARFINTSWYSSEKLIGALKSIYLLRDDLSATKPGKLRYFIAGNIFKNAGDLQYDQQNITPDRLAFTATVPDKSSLAWGIGFTENNRNQYRIYNRGADSFYLQNKYPVAYPLAEEDRNDWSKHTVTKFLVSDPSVLESMPPVFSEGFLFSPFSGDSSIDFAPLLLSYQKDRSGADLQLQARSFTGPSAPLSFSGNQLLLPAKQASFSWVFTIQNSLNWDFGSFQLPPAKWKLLLFGSLFLLVIGVFAASWLRPANRLSWVWQLVSVVSLLLLTTRFFLYWRYKSFPPFEGLDAPSLQQLNSFWNFGIILFATVLLAIIFGFGFIHFVFTRAAKSLAHWLQRPYRPLLGGGEERWEKWEVNFRNKPLIRKRPLQVFIFSWLALLAAGAGLAVGSGYDPGTCRHLAIVLILFYFFFLHISYRYSPLMTASEKSWWSIRTGNSWSLVFSNPVKVLLSVSLLAVFAFIDIGFAIVFLNFLLFNEAFLCINYAIAGLSAGSKKNAGLFGLLAALYLFAFAVNLLAGPYIFNYLLGLPPVFYTAGYFVFALLLAVTFTRLLQHWPAGKRRAAAVVATLSVFFIAFLFFPKDKLLEKAAITKYRIDVMTMPVDQAVETAYRDGKTWEPVIRAAQNQWFINTFIYEKNNPAVNKAGFTLLPHAPQNKGARYNAQATDLVTSRFLIAEHGKWSVLLFVLLLLLPVSLLASFYKLYPDFTNRVNPHYAAVSTGFSLLNYIGITALLVVLAATGRYIFFGQDLPFGSILSKQSILFPVAILVAVVLLFRKIPLEQYPNRKKMLPGAIVFAGLCALLFLVKPAFNKDREFGMSDLAKNMDTFIEARLQPVIDYLDTAAKTRRLPLQQKDRLFADSLRHLLATGTLGDAGKFLTREMEAYSRGSFDRHLDQARLLYLDMHTGRPQLAVNDNYFRVEPPPHLQQNWKGNVFGDTVNYTITLWNAGNRSVSSRRMDPFLEKDPVTLDEDLQVVVLNNKKKKQADQPALVNVSASVLRINGKSLGPKDTFLLSNPCKLRVEKEPGAEKWLVVEPDAFMRNLYVNGGRYYVYPMGEEFIWARNFSESIAAAYTRKEQTTANACISLDAVLMDSLGHALRRMMANDTAYAKNAEYGICIADGNGRLIALTDHIKGMDRPDPNDKAGFNRQLRGENGLISQSLLRKQIGNINLLRMNPGPGSTLKPIVFAAVASQLNLDWDAFAAEGFSQKQNYFGGEKVAEYDFEKNNGRISNVVDYLRYSDNYYHSNLLLLGSYSGKDLSSVLESRFSTRNTSAAFSWPYFTYHGKQYWLQGFQNWPGYGNWKANFGSDSSFLSTGLLGNFGIYTSRSGRGPERFQSVYDSLLFLDAYKKSVFVLPEYALFDQKGTGMDNRKPNEVFMSSFRGHVKGSSQVMIPPVKMLDAFGKLVSQNRAYGLTLNPWAETPVYLPFRVDHGVRYTDYLSLMREKVFEGLQQALFSGTAARLGAKLKNGSPYYYYAKTGTTGDEAADAKSKLFALVISDKDISDPGFNFRNNRFYTIYFTSQNGPAKQNEEFQAAVIRIVQESAVFRKYMKG